jgi:hypothetical protein
MEKPHTNDNWLIRTNLKYNKTGGILMLVWLVKSTITWYNAAPQLVPHNFAGTPS